MEKKATKRTRHAKPALTKPTTEQAATTRKPYEKPTLAKLTPEQVRLKLLGPASMGDQGAKDLLEVISPEVPQKDSKERKKSA